MKAIILAGYTHCEQHPALEKLNGEFRIDILIKELTQIGLSPSVVLGDNHSDEILHNSALVHKCDLIFDDFGPDASKLTNLKAGSKVINSGGLIVPIYSAVPDYKAWNRIKNHYFTKGIDAKKQFVWPFFPKSGAMLPTDYFFITHFGLRTIGRFDDFEALNHQECVSAVPIFQMAFKEAFL